MIFDFKKIFTNNNPFKVSSSLLKQYNKRRPKNKTFKLCHAPSKSMLFIQSGLVMPCHYNRGYSIGNVKEESIHQIWFGDKRSRLIKSINHNDLSVGCFSCYNSILNNSYYFTGAAKYDFFSNKKNKYPEMLDFQISNTCNLQCSMCSGEYSSSIRTKREKKPSYDNAYNDTFIEQIIEFLPYLKSASFTGGEPFLIKQYYKIWDLISVQKNKIDVYISTNGTVYNNIVKNYLDKINFNFTISIDSIIKETYESIRINSTLDNVLKNIEIFNNYCKSHNTKLYVKCCLMKKNILEIPEYFKFWNLKDIEIVTKFVWFPPFASIRELSKTELFNIINTFKKVKLQSNTHIQKRNSERFNEIINQIEEWLNEKNNFQNDIISFTKSYEELVLNVKAKIYDFLIANKTKPVIIEETVENYCKVLYKIAENIPDNKTACFALENFSKLPIHMFISELNRNDFDKLLERFLQAGMEIY